jgi:RNA polymerase sigma-70 factor (ECF subfamily)
MYWLLKGGLVAEVAALWMSGIEPKSDGAEPAEIAAILERAIAGDSAAFEQILKLHERRVLMLAWRLLGNIEDAQDSTQEVFLRAFKYLHRFDTTKPVEAWLVRITVNVCRDFGRHRQRRQSLAAEFQESGITNVDPYSDLASGEQKKMLREAIASLPHKERAALVLRDIEGLSTAEVADILNSSETTVRSQISIARVKIRKAIERFQGGEP